MQFCWIGLQLEAINAGAVVLRQGFSTRICKSRRRKCAFVIFETQPRLPPCYIFYCSMTVPDGKIMFCEAVARIFKNSKIPYSTRPSATLIPGGGSEDHFFSRSGVGSATIRSPI
jgi:hypothetical protein